MNRIRTGTAAAAVAAAVGGGLAARRALTGRRSADRTARWHVLTVHREQHDVAPQGRLPEPLAALGDTVEVQLRPAPGDRGTEIAVRLRDGEPSGLAARLGDDPRQAVRRALRESRQLLETGEILRPDRPTTTRRTLLNRPLAAATRHGKEEGLL